MILCREFSKSRQRSKIAHKHIATRLGSYVRAMTTNRSRDHHNRGPTPRFFIIYKRSSGGSSVDIFIDLQRVIKVQSLRLILTTVTSVAIYSFQGDSNQFVQAISACRGMRKSRITGGKQPSRRFRLYTLCLLCAREAVNNISFRFSVYKSSIYL